MADRAAPRDAPRLRRAAGSRWRVLRLAAGFALLALGVVGLFLPVLQGVLLILAGLAVLQRDIPWAGRLIGWVKRRFRRKAAVDDG